MDDNVIEQVFNIDFPRKCRYIFLKPTNMRKNSQPNFDTHPLEIRYFGAIGHILSENDQGFDDKEDES